jgi:primosomal protein N' (replication factor Y)
VLCSACDIALVFHRGENRLCCHYCGLTRPLPHACPACNAPDLDQVGIGTEQLVEHLAIALPGLRILRMDADAVRSRGRKGHGDILSAFAAGQADCLVGTQMVAKGHDLPRVTFVGVVGADLGLSLPDFRAGERTFQILTQVAGRAGRRDQPGSVVMQTWNPQALPLTAAVDHDVDRFLADELEFRRAYRYPPFGALIHILWKGPQADRVARAARFQGASLTAVVEAKGGTVLGPVMAQPALLDGRYRWQAIVKAPTRAIAGQIVQEAQTVIHGVPMVGVAIDVDPQGPA